MLVNLHEDNFIMIFRFLKQEDIVNLRLVSMSTYKLVYKIPFIRIMKLNRNSCYKTFVKMFSKNRDTLQKVVVENYENPHLWIPEWPKKMVFLNCRFSNTICISQFKNIKYIICKNCDFTEKTWFSLCSSMKYTYKKGQKSLHTNKKV